MAQTCLVCNNIDACHVQVYDEAAQTLLYHLVNFGVPSVDAPSVGQLAAGDIPPLPI